MRENVTLREILTSIFGVLILIVVICIFTGIFKEPSISNNNTTTSSSVATSSNIKTDTSNTKIETKVNTEPNLKIINTHVEDTYSSSSDYKNINITVQNNGTTNINYVKINLFFENSRGSIVKSEWTNDSSCIKPSATQVITKMVKSEGWDSVSSEIGEYH